MLDDWCGPENCGLGGWIYDYQTLITGVLAILGAAVAVFLPEYFRLRSDRQAQIDRGSTISLQIGLMGSQVAATVMQIQDLRLQNQPALILGIELPSLLAFINDAKILIESTPQWLHGPDQDLLLTLSWRIASFRSAVDRARILATLFEAEARDEGSYKAIDDASIGRIVEDLKVAGAATVPKEMAAAFRVDRSKN